MVKPIWLAVAFVVGIGVGVLAMRIATPAVDAMPAESSMVPNASAPEPQPPAAAVAKAQKAEAPAPAPVVSGMEASPPSEPAADSTDDSVPAQPIDVGPKLRAAIDRQSVGENRNEIGDAHRALERQIRDDSWAYAREADIQNSLLPEVSVAAFTVEHVECRATLCEIRLSAQEPQSAALARWSESLHKPPWPQTLWLTNSIRMADDDGTVSQLLILRRPAKGPGAPKQ